MKDLWKNKGKLLPCPFCGGTPKLIIERGFYIPSCDTETCIAYYGFEVSYSKKKTAIDSWNRRAEDDR